MSTSSLRQGRLGRLGTALKIRTDQPVEVHSSAISSFRYNRGEMRLEVTWANGSVYEYAPVKPSLVREMVRVDRDSKRSLGSWFAKNIRGLGKNAQFPFRRLTTVD